MKIMRSLFHFLGGIYCAIILIAIAVLMVIAGTFIESKTDSHLLAASWTYEHPFFFFLLSLFFINILFAALRRWPFKKRHIPFLMTHLGLLMIIAGTMLKNRWGLQGQLTVWEGSGNQSVVLPHSHALLIEAKGMQPIENRCIALDSFHPNIYYPFHYPSLKCKIVGYAPHVKEKLETWIKGSKAYIAGFPPIPVKEWQPSESFPIAETYASHFPTWAILALRTTHLQKALEHLYLQQLTLQLKAKDEETLYIALEKGMQHPFSFQEGSLKIILDLSLLEKENTPSLQITWLSQDSAKEEQWHIPLQGEDALLVKSPLAPWSECPFTVDLIRPLPLLCFMEDREGNTLLFACDTHGRIHRENFTPSQLQSILVYEQGFSGYGVQAHLPIPTFSTSREDKEAAEAYALTLQLRQALEQHPPLAPPLAFFEQACQAVQADFCNTFVQFLTEWKKKAGFLYHPNKNIPEPLATVLQHLQWEKLSLQEKHAMQWIVRFMHQMEKGWRLGEHPMDGLARHHWPFIDELRQDNLSQSAPLLNVIAQQINSLAHYFPPLDFPEELSNYDSGQLMSAYFRAYGIDYRSLLPYRGNGKEQFETLEEYWKAHAENLHLQREIVFETPLSHRVFPEQPPSKVEDRSPGIVLEVQEGKEKYTIALAYDASSRGLKWPILNGKYLIRFQPNEKELPYRIRLRQARQISYPQSQQVYSYESDVLISEQGKEPVAHTLSMNKVYETWDGYRFYLAGIGHSPDGTLKRIQLAVNYDPAKYALTYPGGFLVFLGMILLFWSKKRVKS